MSRSAVRKAKESTRQSPMAGGADAEAPPDGAPRGCRKPPSPPVIALLLLITVVGVAIGTSSFILTSLAAIVAVIAIRTYTVWHRGKMENGRSKAEREAALERKRIAREARAARKLSKKDKENAIRLEDDMRNDPNATVVQVAHPVAFDQDVERGSAASSARSPVRADPASPMASPEDDSSSNGSSSATASSSASSSSSSSSSGSLSSDSALSETDDEVSMV